MGRGLRLAAACAVALLFAAPASAAAKPAILRPHSWVWPASGIISTPFGHTDIGWHPGIDIASLRSLDVRAATPGVVTATGFTAGFDGYGNIVFVDAGSGVQVLYAHLAAVHARIGEHVVPGQFLGIAGCTGSCTGTHLHFEVRVDGTAVNPMPFLPGGIPTAPAGPSMARRLEATHVVRTLFAHLPRVHVSRWLWPQTHTQAHAVARRDRHRRVLASFGRP
jgi:murein DD-endopeptidase MepM/ murein hydrolase activator NlpD